MIWNPMWRLQRQAQVAVLVGRSGKCTVQVRSRGPPSLSLTRRAVQPELESGAALPWEVCRL
jgi:hypothetical protein